MYKTTVLVGFCPVERYDYRMRNTRSTSTCLITIVVRLLMTSSNLHLLQKKSQVRKGDSFAHTSLRSKDKVTSTVSEETKIISPTIIIQQLKDWKEYTVMHANGTTLLPANVHLIQKKKKEILVTH